MDDLPYTIIHRGEGVLIVRVHSTDSDGIPLPDAVFTFRPGEPQYESWRRIYNECNPTGVISNGNDDEPRGVSRVVSTVAERP